MTVFRPERYCGIFYALLADENREYIEYLSAYQYRLSESATSQICVAFLKGY
nr:MAG TPA: hypothetical protein [Caudoviricetes sp.]